MKNIRQAYSILTTKHFVIVSDKDNGLQLHEYFLYNVTKQNVHNNFNAACAGKVFKLRQMFNTNEYKIVSLAEIVCLDSNKGK